MKYFRITSPDNGENIMMSRSSDRKIFHTSGAFIDTKQITLPFQITMYAGEDAGYDQYDPDFEGEPEVLTLEDRLLDFYSESSLMTPKLIEALQQAGVQNIQLFPTEIKEHGSGKVLEKEYLLVNILGLVLCADIDNSDHDPIGETFYFHNLKLDESKTNELPIFRLAESPFEIIINEKVAEIINKGNFKGIGTELLN